MDVETIAWGYGLVEGPRLDEAGNLYFSDVQKGGVFRRAPDGAIETLVPRRRGVGGIALHADGGLVISGRDICHVREGKSRRLFARDDIPGFNDITVDDEGRVLCGSMRSDPFQAEGERTPGELWRIDTEGKATELYGGVGLSNGIGYSPDRTRLYHSDSAARAVIVHDVAPDGSLSNRRALRVQRGARRLAFPVEFVDQPDRFHTRRAFPQKRVKSCSYCSFRLQVEDNDRLTITPFSVFEGIEVEHLGTRDRIDRHRFMRDHRHLGRAVGETEAQPPEGHQEQGCDVHRLHGGRVLFRRGESA